MKMAPRFLAFVSKSSFCEGRISHFGRYRAPSNLKLALSTDRVRVFVRHEFDSLSNGQAGIVIGKVFSKHYPFARLMRVPAATQNDLVRDYWGQYVSFRHDGDVVSILRDPSGAMPCCFVDGADVTLFASDVDLLVEAGYRPAINWSFFTQHFRSYELRTPTTGLDGVTEILAGTEAMMNGANMSFAQRWSPWDHTSDMPSTTDAERAEQLRSTITAAVRAQARCYRSILLGVSGGLDSSVIAAALATGEPSGQLTCLTMATEDAEGDERHYVRKLMNALGLTALERFYDDRQVDITKSSSTHLPRPMLFAFAQSAQAARAGIAQSVAAEAYFTGIGGDNIFCHILSAAPIVDRILATGINTHLWHTLVDVCRLNGATIWEAGAKAVDRLWHRMRRYPWPFDDSYLNRDLTQSVPFSEAHPWQDAPRGALPGKISHVSFLTRIQGTIDGLPRDGPLALVNPLLCQPIIELCLSIPSWTWVKGGRNRSIVRTAFESQLPREILNRRSKGGPSSFAYNLVDANKGELLSRLRNGELVAQGILDARQLQDALGSSRPIPANDFVRLSAFAEAENWIRYWRSRNGEL